MSSDVLIDYLLEDERELVLDLDLELRGELTPEGAGVDGHNTSHCVASLTSSWIPEIVSLVRVAGTCGIRLVAATGMRKWIAEL
jgi:hypothetical protein